MKIVWLGLLPALAGCVATTLDALAPVPSGAHYVATGSSFAAGAGILPRKGGPERCGRSERNYATLLAAKLQLRLDDQTCNGANTSHLLGPWNELPAQLDAVGPQTRLVTATIGGNDLNYALYLIAAGCGDDGTVMIAGRPVACPPAIEPTAADYARLEANLRQIVRTVKTRAPNARVILVQYVAMVPDHPCDGARLSGAKAEVAREIANRLSQVTARAARLEGGEVLATDLMSRNHRPCDAQPWSTGTREVAGDGMIWHPTALGHASIAEALAEKLRPRPAQTAR